jgi:hypothetical protein
MVFLCNIQVLVAAYLWAQLGSVIENGKDGALTQSFALWGPIFVRLLGQRCISKVQYWMNLSYFRGLQFVMHCDT